MDVSSPAGLEVIQFLRGWWERSPLAEASEEQQTIAAFYSKAAEGPPAPCFYLTV